MSTAIVQLFEPLLRRPSHDPAVISACSSSGISASEAVLPDGEYRAYVERPNLGFALVFTDESYFRKNDESIGTRGLLLTGLFLYLEAVDNYAPFTGELPLSLSRADLRSDIIRKVGNPTTSRTREDGSIRFEAWHTRCGHTLSVTFSPQQVPSVLSLNASEGEA